MKYIVDTKNEHGDTTGRDGEFDTLEEAIEFAADALTEFGRGAPRRARITHPDGKREYWSTEISLRAVNDGEVWLEDEEQP